MQNRVFITGDTHGNFRRVRELCNKAETSKDDTLIILGDSGINYYTDLRRKRYIKEVAKLPITLFCIHGNHEERAENIDSYIESQFWEGRVLIEEDYPSIKFALDGEIFNIPTTQGKKQAIVIGGAYSVDKYYRLQIGAKWYSSEQPSDKIKRKVEQILERENQEIDIILSHTCPYKYIPREWFLASIDQNTVDNSTELWLDTIQDNLKRYEKWYCGHYHGNKVIDKMVFMFEDIKEL